MKKKKRVVLVIGSGGREAVIVWKIKDQLGPDVEIHCAPGNAGMIPMAKLWDVEVNDIDGLCALAQKLKADLVIPGLETPLVLGIRGRLGALGITCVGPGEKAARLEGSKIFAKRFMRRHNIRTADFEVFDDPTAAKRYFWSDRQRERWPGNLLPVIKADGLCGGKGVVLPEDLGVAYNAIEDIMVKKKFGAAGKRILFEKRLVGCECSFIVVTDGAHAIPFLPAADYKRRFDGNKGLNTGGMGGYCPNPLITPLLHEEIMEDIVLPTIRGMAYEGTPYRGILYFGLMITKDGIYVLEINCRLGDPEASVILPLLESDLVGLLLASAIGNLAEVELKWKDDAAVVVVLTDEKYPEGKSETTTIFGTTEAVKHGALVFPAGVSSLNAHNWPLVTSGGRILEVVGVGKDFATARNIAYAGAKVIEFKGKAYRQDIAAHLVK